MLTEVKAYSSWRSAPTLPLVEGGTPDRDLIQVRNIEGLNPVKASVNTSPFGSVDGASYVGSSVISRNIVLTLHPNPNWDDWTYEGLRRLLYQYFMPKREVRLVFYSDDMDPVEISGYVEDVGVNMFSKDPELLVSIICPDPYFTSTTPKVISGLTIHDRLSFPVEVDYKGTVETGIKLKVTATADTPPTSIGVQVGPSPVLPFGATATISPTMYFEMSSLPMKKFVQNVTFGSGVITNLLPKVREGSLWTVLQPGVNEFGVYTDVGAHDWELTYFERFGGL